METHPDSALSLLKSIPHPETLHGKAQADYCLLMTQALDKNYMTQPSDSLIRIALGYYGSHSTDQIAIGKVYFYYGRVKHENKEIESAINYYLRARSVLDGTKEYKMLGLIAGNIGYINKSQKLYDIALNEYKASLRCFEEGKDTLGVIFACRDIGRVCLFKKEMDSASYYYNKALRLTHLNYTAYESPVLHDLGILHRAMGNFSLAKSYFLSSARMEKDKRTLCSIYLSLGYLHIQMNDNDTARKYLQLSLESKSIATQKDAYNCLYRIERREGDFYSALKFKESADSLVNIMHNVKTSDGIADLQKKYDNEKLQRENLQISIEKKNLFFISSFISLLAAIIVFYLYNKNRSNKKRIQEIEQTILYNENSIISYRRAMDKLQESEEDNQNCIGELRGKITILTVQNKDLASRLKDLGGSNLKTDDPAVSEHLAAFRILLSLKLSNFQDYKLSGIDWNQLFCLFNLLYVDFVNRLRIEFPELTKHDLEICCLIKGGFNHEQMSIIFHTISDSLTKAKGRLKKRLNLSAEEDLEKFIRKY